MMIKLLMIQIKNNVINLKIIVVIYVGNKLIHNFQIFKINIYFIKLV